MGNAEAWTLTEHEVVIAGGVPTGLRAYPNNSVDYRYEYTNDICALTSAHSE